MDDPTKPSEAEMRQPLPNALDVRPGVDYPLPPEHLRDQLLNEPEGAPSRAAKPASTSIADLDYVDAPERTITLQYPFRLNGQVIDAVTVRALTLEETSKLVQAKGAANLTSYDFYAEMTGLPENVIRALRGRDGADVSGAGWDFLPRWMTGELGD